MRFDSGKIRKEKMKNQEDKGNYRLVWVFIIGILFCGLTSLPVQARYMSMNEAESTELPRYSLYHFLKTALQPVGRTVYIWGGGWNEEDTAAGVEAQAMSAGAYIIFGITWTVVRAM